MYHNIYFHSTMSSLVNFLYNVGFYFCNLCCSKGSFQNDTLEIWTILCIPVSG